jgi:hypothetical protein
LPLYCHMREKTKSAISTAANPPSSKSHHRPSGVVTSVPGGGVN